jgi:hypothetical protein
VPFTLGAENQFWLKSLALWKTACMSYFKMSNDKVVKSQKSAFYVIPAEAGHVVKRQRYPVI